jgi:redox-sensitive bicupin YhaK (pirin superfamily)
MITRRRAEQRGHFDFGWLNTYHTFSFGEYHDPQHMGFRTLRVINEDRVLPGRGFGTHAHRDMEIISYVLEGSLEHKDSLGTGSVIRPGDVQRMSAGTGVTHSEFNPSPTEVVHFLQIWIVPDHLGIAPSYEQKTFSDAEKSGQLRLIASRDGRQGSVTVHQDVSVSATILQPRQTLDHQFRPDRHAWVQVARGSVTLNDERLDESDGAALSNEPVLRLVGRTTSEVLVFDLP